MSFLFVFAYVFIIHIILHRMLLRVRTVTLKTLIVYPAGLFVLLYFRVAGYFEVPLYFLMLYTMVSILISVLYLGVYLGGQTPASMILDAYAKKKSYTQKQLLSLFSEDMLLWKRLDDLLRAKFVKTNHIGYAVTSKGYAIFRFFHAYQHLIRTKNSG